MEIWKGENDMGVLIEMLHHNTEDDLQKAKDCIKLNFRTCLLAHISTSLQN